MTQQAKLQKYKDKGKHDAGPSTPVVITGGGGLDDDVGLGIPTISFVSAADPPSALVFRTNPPGLTSWRQATSEVPILISQVVVGETVIPIDASQHPVTITFERAGFPSFNVIERVGEGSKYVVFLNVVGPTLFAVTESSGDGWVASSSEALDSYDRIIIGEQEVALSGGFTVELYFEG